MKSFRQKMVKMIISGDLCQIKAIWCLWVIGYDIHLVVFSCRTMDHEWKLPFTATKPLAVTRDPRTGKYSILVRVGSGFRKFSRSWFPGPNCSDTYDIIYLCQSKPRGTEYVIFSCRVGTSVQFLLKLT